MKAKTRSINLVATMWLAILLLAGATASRADEQAEPRLSTTSQGQGIQRGGVGDGTVSHDEFGALLTTGDRNTMLRSAGQQKISATGSQDINSDFWFFDADVELFSDFDADGYYFGVDLLFDVDTVFVEADVYAVLYLSLDFGPWNEYAVTDDFTIFGASAGDEYTVVSELVSGYPTGEYDLLIELYDVFDGSLVATFGPEDTSELSILPIEDAGRDAPGETRIIVTSEGGGGSFDWLALLALVGVAGSVRFSRRCH